MSTGFRASIPIYTINNRPPTEKGISILKAIQAESPLGSNHPGFPLAVHWTHSNHYTETVQATSFVIPPSRIVLTGFMGSGKSTLGPLIAARLGWSFIDVDDVIEAEAGVTIAELFARHGAAGFRARERATIARLAGGDSLVLALGGGAIEHEAT